MSKSRLRLAAWMATLIAVLVGCDASAGAHPSDAQLLETIPRQVGNVQVQRSALSGLQSGLLIDDAVAALGKTRTDAAVAGGEAPNVTILAVAVRGVSGEDLERATVDHWPAATGGFPGEIAGRPVVLLDHPSQDDVVVMRVGNVVYVVQSSDAAIVKAAVSALPVPG